MKLGHAAQSLESPQRNYKGILYKMTPDKIKKGLFDKHAYKASYID